MMSLAILGLCTAGGKIGRLGKGWYEIYQGVRQLPRSNSCLPPGGGVGKRAIRYPTS